MTPLRRCGDTETERNTDSTREELPFCLELNKRRGVNSYPDCPVASLLAMTVKEVIAPFAQVARGLGRALAMTLTVWWWPSTRGNTFRLLSDRPPPQT